MAERILAIGEWLKWGACKGEVEFQNLGHGERTKVESI